MISVCIATHNGGLYIKEQIQSILNQLGEDDEIIVSDDGSSDNTLEIINSFSDQRIKTVNYEQSPLKNKRNAFIYASRNFENALRNAKGDYIFLSDQDDVWYSNKLAIVKNALDKYDIVKHNFSKINETGEMLEYSHYDYKEQTDRNWLNLMANLPFRGCCMAFRRWILEESLPFPKNCLQHDSWIGMVAKYKNAKYFYIEKPLLYHRTHSRNVSESVTKNSICFKIYYRLKLIALVINRYNQFNVCKSKC